MCFFYIFSRSTQLSASQSIGHCSSEPVTFAKVLKKLIFGILKTGDMCQCDIYCTCNLEDNYVYGVKIFKDTIFMIIEPHSNLLQALVNHTEVGWPKVR